MGPSLKKMRPDKVALFKQVAAGLHSKRSNPFVDKSLPHNYMHNKVLVADNLVLTGSFNFSDSAMANAENVVSVSYAGLADQYVAYIKELMATYPI